MPDPPPAPPDAPPVVAVCIATCRRPRGLRALLESLAAALPSPGAVPAFVVVVDNGGDGSAVRVAARLRESFPFPLVLAEEPERNIALARNRGVREALRRGAGWIAFVDDDQVVCPGWLGHLLEGARRFQAQVVAGAVVAVLPPEAPAWMRGGDFHQPPRHPTGTAVRYVGTGNVLVSAALLAADDGPFDPAFGVSGGSDSVFFARCARRGARFVFVDEAVAEERVPPARARAGWILRRAFRVGNVAVHAERAAPAGAGRPCARALRGALHLLYGAAATLPLALAAGRGGAVRGLRRVAYGAGAFAALAGYRVEEYRARALPDEPPPRR